MFIFTLFIITVIYFIHCFVKLLFIMENPTKSLCHKCSKTVTFKVLQCATCLRQYHPNCLQKYTAVKDARACCSAAYIAMRSQSSARRKSDRQALDRSLSRANIFDSTRSIINSSDKPNENPLSSASAKTSFTHPQLLASTVDNSSLKLNIEEQVSQFGNLPLDQKLTSLFRQILNQTNELADIKSQLQAINDTIDNHEDRLALLESGRVDDRTMLEEKLANTKQALAYSQHQKSLAEVIIGGIPAESSLSELVITQKVLQKIDASKYMDDIITAKKRSLRKHDKSNANSADLPKTCSIIVRFKSENVRNEIIRLKKLHGNISASEIFSEFSNTSYRILINGWLQPHMFKLLQLTRTKAKSLGYERVWVIQRSHFRTQKCFFT